MAGLFLSEESDMIGVIQVVPDKHSVTQTQSTVSKGHETLVHTLKHIRNEILEMFGTNKAGCFVNNSQFRALVDGCYLNRRQG